VLSLLLLSACGEKHQAAKPAPPLPTVSRGDRPCDDCRAETAHTATRTITVFGRRLIIAAVFLVAVMLTYFYLTAGLGRPLALFGTSLLTLVVGALIVFVASRRTEYVLVCEQCGRTTTRLSPPQWSRRRAHRRRSSESSDTASS